VAEPPRNRANIDTGSDDLAWLDEILTRIQTNRRAL
jgi:hypothetical protein